MRFATDNKGTFALIFNASDNDIRLVVYCDDNKVLDVMLSDTYCDIDDWSAAWSGDMKKIYFPDEDTASDFYFRPHLQLEGM